MDPPLAPSSPRVRFGIFELDMPSGELRRNGTPVRLQRSRPPPHGISLLSYAWV